MGKSPGLTVEMGLIGVAGLKGRNCGRVPSGQEMSGVVEANEVGGALGG